VKLLKSTCLPILVALLGAAPAPVADADERGAEARLEALKGRIAAIERAQRRDAQRRDKASRALRESEIAVAREAKALEATRREKQDVTRRLDNLGARREQLAAGLAADSGALAAELRAAWMAGGEPRLKLMLNQRDPGELGRMLTWHGYLARDRAARIVTLRDRLAELAEIGRQLETENARLSAIERRQAEALSALDAARSQRMGTVARLETDLDRRSREAERLRQEAAALEQLIEQLRAAVVDLPIPDDSPFTAQRGRLAWPAQGPLLRDFGERRGEGPRANGVLIGAARGAEVAAVWHGRVAYADWLPGLGLLLVIEHGDGYLSLYGHNEVLFSAVGDWVSAGQVVARAGDSGGRERAGLYFEIRSGTRPEDPKTWFAGRLVRPE
jgi:murein hydrolase activator